MLTYNYNGSHFAQNFNQHLDYNKVNKYRLAFDRSNLFWQGDRISEAKKAFFSIITLH